MTAPEWDAHWDLIREDAVKAGRLPTEAEAFADVATAVQFGTRPQETP